MHELFSNMFGIGRFQWNGLRVSCRIVANSLYVLVSSWAAAEVVWRYPWQCFESVPRWLEVVLLVPLLPVPFLSFDTLHKVLCHILAKWRPVKALQYLCCRLIGQPKVFHEPNSRLLVNTVEEPVTPTPHPLRFCNVIQQTIFIYLIRALYSPAFPTTSRTCFNHSSLSWHLRSSAAPLMSSGIVFLNRIPSSIFL